MVNLSELDQARRARRSSRGMPRVGELAGFDPTLDNLQPPVYRVGGGGSNWRHIKQCFNNNGSFLTFMDGTVKLDDCRRYPPTGLIHPASDLAKIHAAFKKTHFKS